MWQFSYIIDLKFNGTERNYNQGLLVPTPAIFLASKPELGQ